MKTITLREQGTIKAIGTHTKNSKPVVCVTDGMKFASATDAAEYAGVHVSSISYCCTGRYNSVKGKVYKYIKDETENCVDILADTVQEQQRLFEKYRDIIAKMEAEERRKEAEEKRYEQWCIEMERANKNLEVAKTRLDKAQVAFESAAEKYAKAEETLARLMEMA